MPNRVSWCVKSVLVGRIEEITGVDLPSLIFATKDDLRKLEQILVRLNGEAKV